MTKTTTNVGMYAVSQKDLDAMLSWVLYGIGMYDAMIERFGANKALKNGAYKEKHELCKLFDKYK